MTAQMVPLVLPPGRRRLLRAGAFALLLAIAATGTLNLAETEVPSAPRSPPAASDILWLGGYVAFSPPLSAAA